MIVELLLVGDTVVSHFLSDPITLVNHILLPHSVHKTVRP